MFKKAQTTLKRVLPNSCFNLLYKTARCGYRLWARTSDELYFPISGMLYALKGDFKNFKKARVLQSVRPYTMVGRTGLLATYDAACEIEKKNLAGSFVECGVAKGGCSALMATVARQNGSRRKMWLFDSFEGLPKPAKEDESAVNENPGRDRSISSLHEGYCLGTYDEVSKLLFTKLGFDKEKVFMVKGWFQDTLPKHREEVGEISFLRIDADWYESTKCCLENLFDNVVSGGYVLIDDYDLAGCKRAVDEFLEKREIHVRFTFDDRGGAYFVKP